MSENLKPEANDPLSSLPGYSLRRAANAMMAELGNRLGEIGLRITDATLMLLLEGDTRRTSSELGRILDIQRANMVPILQRLEKLKLIAREPIDRKSFAIVLTEEGRGRILAARQVIVEFENELLQRIPAQHRDHLLPALDALWRDAGA